MISSLIIFILAIVLSFIAFRYTLGKKWVVHFYSKNSHPAFTGVVTPQIGGIIIFSISIVISMVSGFYSFHWSDNNLLFLLVCILCISVIGAVDDRFLLPSTLRLFLFLVIAIFVVKLTATQIMLPINETLLFGFFVISTIWVINTANFIDGIDLSIVANTLPAFVFCNAVAFLLPTQPFFEFFIPTLTGALLAFAWFNKPLAKAYLGDAGSLTIGLSLAIAALIIFGQKNSIAGLVPITYMLFDTTMTLLIRIYKKENILKAHNQHAYQRAHSAVKNKRSIAKKMFAVSSLNSIIAYGLMISQYHTFMMQLFTLIAALLISICLYVHFWKLATSPNKDG